MRSFKHFGVLVVVFALCAIGAGNASAAPKFTASATGSLAGHATTNQVFTAGFGSVSCAKAAWSGTISSTESTEQEAAVAYSECKALGVATAHILEEDYLITANRTVHFLTSTVITVTKTVFTPHCTITITPQTPGGVVDLVPLGSDLRIFWTLTGLKYHSSGGPCGSAGEHTDGTFEGTDEVERVGGGSIGWDE